MTDKLTDSEIVKALEDALYRIKGAEHLIVPKEGVDNLCNGLENALDLINRLQAENKSQSIMIKMLKGSIEDYKNSYINQKAEIERLKTNLNIELENFATEYDNKIKAEAYKEFAEKAKEFMHNKFKALDEYEFEYITERDIDNLLKEMVGENNATT